MMNPDEQCDYKENSMEMACTCSTSSMTVNSLAELLEDHSSKRIESVSFSDCDSLDLNISTVDLLWTAIYQVRIENAEYVTIRGVDLSSDDVLDIHVNNVREHFNLMGDLKCSSCDMENNTDTSLPWLSVQIRDSSCFNIQEANIRDVNFRFKSRNVENIRMSNTFIKNLEQHGIEIFYSKTLRIKNSVFQTASNSSILLNHVDSFSLDHTFGITNRTYDLLSPSTYLKISCNIPNKGSSLMWDNNLCGPPGFSNILSTRKNRFLSASVSPSLVISCVAAVFIAALIVVILFLQKKGKLDDML